jgi:hypothetical protein
MKSLSELFKYIAEHVGIKFHEQEDKTFLVTDPTKPDPIARVSPEVVKQLKKEKVIKKTESSYVSPRSRYEVQPTKAKKLHEDCSHYHNRHGEDSGVDPLISAGLGVAAGFALADLFSSNDDSSYVVPSHESLSPLFGNPVPSEPSDSVTSFSYEDFSPSATEPERDNDFGSSSSSDFSSSDSSSSWDSGSSSSSDFGSSDSSSSSSDW